MFWTNSTDGSEADRHLYFQEPARLPRNSLLGGLNAIRAKTRTKGLVAVCLAAFASAAWGQEPSYKYEFTLTSKPLALNLPFSCVADNVSRVAFFTNTKGKETSICEVEKPHDPLHLRITIAGKRADVVGANPFGLIHVWYDILRQDESILILGSDTDFGHDTITVDLKRGAFVDTGSILASGEVSVTSWWGHCQND
jgi:hypothetical protein